MRTVRIQGFEQMSDGGRRSVEVELKFTEADPAKFADLAIHGRIIPGTEGVTTDVPEIEEAHETGQ